MQLKKHKHLFDRLVLRKLQKHDVLLQVFIKQRRTQRPTVQRHKRTKIQKHKDIKIQKHKASKLQRLKDTKAQKNKDTLQYVLHVYDQYAHNTA
jgi:hypothetical protein